MKKFVCTVCGYVFEGEAAPAECPVCHAGADKFKEQTGEREWAAEHVIGVAQGVSEDILADLRANFEGECTEVGMYLAMARVAHREGYPEIFTGKKQLGKRLSTLLNLLNFSAKLLQTAQRKTLRCV
jgi:hypothetical protein